VNQQRTLDLLTRCSAMIASFEAPDGEHRALKSAYSRRGVCTILKHGHLDTCLAWRALIVEIEAFLTEHEQPALEEVAG